MIFFSGDLMKQLSLPKKNYDFDPVLLTTYFNFELVIRGSETN